MKQSGSDNQILNPIRNALSAIPLDKVKVCRAYRIPNTSITAGTVIQLPKNIGASKLVVEYKKSGEPKTIRETALQISKVVERLESAYGLIIAPYISEQAAQICREENVGYVDLSGNCFIRFGNVLVDKSGRSNRFVIRKEQRSLFSNKATRILRVLLSNPRKCWGVRELAKEANVSPGYVSRIRRYLIDREWMPLGKDNLSLKNPKQVLEEWGKAIQLRASDRFQYFTLEKPGEFETMVAQYCARNGLNYALSGFSGAIRYAPMVPSKTVTAYVSGDIPRIASELGLKTVESGANVTLVAPYDDGVYYGSQTIDGIRVVSPLQVYLDLINVKGRGEEAAQAVFDKKVSSLW